MLSSPRIDLDLEWNIHDSEDVAMVHILTVLTLRPNMDSILSGPRPMLEFVQVVHLP